MLENQTSLSILWVTLWIHLQNPPNPFQEFRHRAAGANLATVGQRQVPAEQVTSLSGGHTHLDKLISTPRGNVEIPIKCGRKPKWLEKAHVSTDSQTKHRKVPNGIWTRTFSLGGERANHYATIHSSAGWVIWKLFYITTMIYITIYDKVYFQLFSEINVAYITDVI